MVKLNLSNNSNFSQNCSRISFALALGLMICFCSISNTFAQRPGTEQSPSPRPGTSQGQSNRPGTDQPQSNRPGTGGSNRPGTENSGSTRPGVASTTRPNLSVRPGAVVSVSTRPGIEERQRKGIQQVGEVTAEVQKAAAIRRTVSGPEADVDRADAMLEKGNIENALNLYRKALDAQPNLISANMGIGSAYIKLGKYEDAINEYQKVVEKAPNNVEAKTNLGVALYRSGRIDEAINQYETLISQRKEKMAPTYFNLAVAYAHKGEFQKAISSYNTALVQRNNVYPEVYNNIGLVYEAIDERDKAVESFRMAIKQQRGAYALAHYNLGRMYHQQDKKQEAIDEYLLATKQDPNFAEAYLDLGNIYLIRSSVYNTPELGKAVENYRKAIKTRDELYPLAYENLAIALTKQGDIKGALDTYLIAFDQYEGRCPETLQNLMNSITKGDYFIINNELLRPDNAGNLRNTKKNRQENNEVVLKRIANTLEKFEALDEEYKANPIVRYCVGRSYYLVGNWNSAMNEFLESIKLTNNDNPIATQAFTCTAANKIFYMLPR